MTQPHALDKLLDLIGELHVIYAADAREKIEKTGRAFETSSWPAWS